MRISDWSSDVCSSDLSTPRPSLQQRARMRWPGSTPRTWTSWSYTTASPLPNCCIMRICSFEIGRASCRGKSVSVRVDLGGRRIIKKKTDDTMNNTEEHHKTQSIYTCTQSKNQI